MDFWRTIVVLFRRWYVTVPAFFATLGLAAAAYSLVPVQYESDSILMLTTPLTGGTEATEPDRPNPVTNPLMNFDHSLALAATVIIQQLRSSETADTLRIMPGGTTRYEVGNGSSNPELLESGPFIFVSGVGSSPEAAQNITERVSTTAAAVLAARQEELKAPPSTRIQLQVVVAATAGRPLEGSPLRAAVGAGGLAALASLAAVYGLESLMAHRRIRRLGEQRESDEDDLANTTAPGADRGDKVSAGVRTRPARSLEPAASPHLVRSNSTAEEG